MVSDPTSLTVTLPEPRHDGTMPVETALTLRRSVRSFSRQPLELSEISQIVWAAQGITHPAGLRTAPSAGALYPLEIHVLAGTVNRLPAGTYRYSPRKHELEKTVDGDKRRDLCSASLQQPPVKQAPAAIIICGIFGRTTIKYGDRGIRYVHMEAGHAAQNVCLQAVALGLETVVIGAFNDDNVRDVLQLKSNEQPLYIIPVGRSD